MKKIKLLLPLTSAAIVASSICSLASCNDSTTPVYKVTDQSIGVTFTKLPKEAIKNTVFNAVYEIDNPINIIDPDNSDILVSNKSIKALPGVIYKEGSIVIPETLITGDITIKLAVKADTSPITITNKSDSNISLYGYPQTSTKGTEIVANYNAAAGKKLDVNNSIIVINHVEYKLGYQIIFDETTITIPKDLVRGNITFILKAVDNLFTVTNQSDKNIVFAKLPESVKEGESISTTYRIKNEQILDYANSSITSAGQQIKTHCTIDDGVLEIPQTYINGDLIIKLVLRDRQTLTVTATGANVHFNIATTVAEKTKLTGSYTLDSGYELDIANCVIKAGDYTITDRPGVIYTNNIIEIPAEEVKGNINITLAAKKDKVVDTVWADVINACNDLENGTIQESVFFQRISINGAAATSADDLIGARMTIQLHVKDAFYQTYQVRIVDFKHDNFVDAEGNTKTAALTFELVGLVSDENNDYMRMTYHDADPSDIRSYEESDIYKALNSETTLEKGWMNKQGSETIETRSVLTMLNEWQPAFVNNIKTTTKKLSKWSDSESKYIETDQTFKLFPLTYTEMGFAFSPDIPQECTTYKYWDGKPASARVKTDFKSSIGTYWLTTPYKVWDPSTQKYLPTQACFVGSDGLQYRNDGRYACAVSFAFNI